MGFFGTTLFLATTGITIYYFPILFFSISWEYLVAIRKAKAIESVNDIIRLMGWTVDNAVSEANKIFTISIIVCVLISVMMFASILYSYRQIEN